MRRRRYACLARPWKTDAAFVNSTNMSMPQVVAAAANNAAWCAAMWRAHGLPVEYRHGLAFCPIETPRFYPNVVSFDATIASQEQIGLIEALALNIRFQFDVKDSFNCLPLETLSFELMFDAVWLWRDPIKEESIASELLWRTIDVDQLPEWEAAWRGTEEPALRTFPDALLQDGHVSMVASFDAKMRIVAGMVAYEAAGVVVITNIFGQAFPPASSVTAMSEVPTVGYERGRALATARHRGFSEVGALKIWSSPQKR